MELPRFCPSAHLVSATGNWWPYHGSGRWTWRLWIYLFCRKCTCMSLIRTLRRIAFVVLDIQSPTLGKDETKMPRKKPPQRCLAFLNRISKGRGARHASYSRVPVYASKTSDWPWRSRKRRNGPCVFFSIHLPTRFGSHSCIRTIQCCHQKRNQSQDRMGNLR